MSVRKGRSGVLIDMHKFLGCSSFRRVTCWTMLVSYAAAVASVICCDGMPWLQTAAGIYHKSRIFRPLSCMSKQALLCSCP